MNNIIIIQARLASQRLPAKIIKKMPNGVSVLEQIVTRMQKVKCVTKIIIASPYEDQKNILKLFARKEDIDFFGGNTDDVLDRYYQCANYFKGDVIIRVTADDPFRDTQITEQALQCFANADYDYLTTVGLPDGLDVEIFSFDALQVAWREADLLSDHEHVTPFIWRQPEKFKLGRLDFAGQFGNWRLTLDEEKDWQVVKAIDESLSTEYGCYYNADAINDFLLNHPEVVAINSDIERNWGYKKSLREDVKYNGKV